MGPQPPPPTPNEDQSANTPLRMYLPVTSQPPPPTPNEDQSRTQGEYWDYIRVNQRPPPTPNEDQGMSATRPAENYATAPNHHPQRPMKIRASIVAYVFVDYFECPTTTPNAQ